MWQVLAGDVQLVRQVFAHLLEVLLLSLPYQEKRKGNRTVRVETSIPKAVRPHTHTYTHTCIHTYIHTHTHTHTHTHAHTLTCIYTHTHLHIIMHTHTLTYIRTYTHIHKHTHTHTQATNAIGVLCQVDEVAEVVMEIFSRLLSTLLLRIGVSCTMEPPEGPKGKRPSSIRYLTQVKGHGCSEAGEFGMQGRII